MDIREKALDLMRRDDSFREALIHLTNPSTKTAGQKLLNQWLDDAKDSKEAIELVEWLIPDNYRDIVREFDKGCTPQSEEGEEKEKKGKKTDLLPICLEAHNLGMIFNKGTKKEFCALKDVNFVITDIPNIGEMVSIVGPSGCGKSTLLNIIAGFDGYVPPTEGEILIEGKPVSGPGKNRGMIFQRYSSFPHLNVRQNIHFGFEVNEDYRNLSKHEREEQVDDWINKVGLHDHKDKYPSQLSGGQQQRVAIARTLILKPRFILMDEPFSALDEPTRLEMQELLVNLYIEVQPTIMIVTHSITEAVYLSDRVWLMGANPGTIVKEFKDMIPPVKGIKPIQAQEEDVFKHAVKTVMEEFNKVNVTRV